MLVETSDKTFHWGLRVGRWMIEEHSGVMSNTSRKKRRTWRLLRGDGVEPERKLCFAEFSKI